MPRRGTEAPAGSMGHDDEGTAVPGGPLDPPAGSPAELGPAGRVQQRRRLRPGTGSRGRRPLRWLGPWAPAIAVSLLFLLLAANPASAAGGELVATASSAAGSGNSSTPYIQHVVMVLLENQELYDIQANGPYEDYLSSTYGNVTNFYAACHPSAPNYLALIAATTEQCGSDNWNNYTETTIGTLLQAKGLTWESYAQDLPLTACTNPGSATSGLFATRHVPFLYFSADTKWKAYCHLHLHTGQRFQEDVANGTLANYSFYTPNLCNDGHNPCGGNTTLAQMALQADTWLRGFLSPILNHTGVYNTAAERSLIAHTLFIITYDEGTGLNDYSGYVVPGITHGDNYAWCAANGGPAGAAVCGGHVFCVFVSPYSVGTTFTQNDSDYGIVHTVEWLFHLPHLDNPGHYDASSGFPVMKSLFSFKSNGK